MCLSHIRRQADTLHAAIILILSYPFIMVLDRANAEIFLFIFLYMFVFNYRRRPWLSMVALACAIAMKLFPVFFGLIYLSDKKYKELVLTLALAFFVNLIGYGVYPGGIFNNIASHLLNLRISSLYYGLDGRDIIFSHSLLAALKYLLLSFAQRPDLEVINARALSISRWITPVLTLFVSAWCVFVEKEMWKKAALLTCLMLLTPAVSADYRLIHLYIPFFAWLDDAPVSPNDRYYAMLYGGLFIPKTYAHLAVLPEASVSIVINAFLMLFLIAMIVIEDIRQNRLVDTFGQFFEYGKRINRKYAGFLAGVCVILMIGLIAFRSSSFTFQESGPKQKTIDALYRNGQQAEEHSQWADADGYYAQWIILEPDNPAPRIHLARVYIIRSRYMDAYRQFQKAMWLVAGSPQLHAEVEDGLLSTLELTVSDKTSLGQFQQAKLLLDVHNKLYQDLPHHLWLNCLLGMTQGFGNWASGFECYNNLRRGVPLRSRKTCTWFRYSEDNDVCNCLVKGFFSKCPDRLPSLWLESLFRQRFYRSDCFF